MIERFDSTDIFFFSEFTPIGEWVREHSVFNMMKRLRFFKTYMALRMLRTWRAAAKSRHFDRIRKSLESRLFLAKPEFCYTIQDVFAKIHDLKQIKLIEADGKPLTLTDFSREQEDRRK